MNTPGFLKCAGAVAALATIAACSGGSTLSPSSVPAQSSARSPKVTYQNNTLFVSGRPVTAAKIGNAAPRFESILAAKHSKDYEYIFNDYGSYGTQFNYPASDQMVGQLEGAGGQGCTNVLYGYGKKTFWNAGRTNNVVTEYTVPDNAVVKTLALDYVYTSSCAMNTAGDLAVGVLLGNNYDAGGQEVIFKKSAGKGKVYNTPMYKAYFAGYDDKGNLFADGENQSYGFVMVELPKGAKKFVQISTSNSPEFPGSVQWDGKYITVFDQLTSETYQYTVSGTTATLKNTISYSGAGDCAQTWLVKGLMYCADAYNNNGSVFKYPAGGSPVAVLSGSFDFPLGVVAAHK